MLLALAATAGTSAGQTITGTALKIGGHSAPANSSGTVGPNNVAASNSMAIGKDNLIYSEGGYSTVSGIGSGLNSICSLISGSYNSIHQGSNCSLVAGSSNTVSSNSPCSLLAGAYNSTSGLYSAVFGQLNTNTVAHSITSGYNMSMDQRRIPLPLIRQPTTSHEPSCFTRFSSPSGELSGADCVHGNTLAHARRPGSDRSNRRFKLNRRRRNSNGQCHQR